MIRGGRSRYETGNAFRQGIAGAGVYVVIVDRRSVPSSLCLSLGTSLENKQKAKKERY